MYCAIGLCLTDKVGRVKPLIVSALGLAGALVVSAALSQHLDPNNQNMLRAMVAMNLVFSLFYTPLGIISWVYPAEVFPVECRALGNAITTFVSFRVCMISFAISDTFHRQTGPSTSYSHNSRHKRFRRLGSAISTSSLFSISSQRYAIPSSTLRRAARPWNRWMSSSAINWCLML